MNALFKLNARVQQRAKKTQRGAVAVMFGLTVVVLVGFAGLAIDLGRFFVIKAELQNAMDACALSAASQLKPGGNDANALIRAVAYGKVFITGGEADAATGKAGNDPKIQNRVNFQAASLNPDVLQITFSDRNNGTYFLASIPPDVAEANRAKFVKCNYPLAGLPIFFMRVLNPLLDTQTIQASAVATREAPLSSCVPVAVCAPSTGTPANNFGYTVGQWITVIDGSSYGTGHFGWGSLIAGDANQIGSELSGSAQCDVSNNNQTIHGQGQMAGLAVHWNTRFGLYANGHSLDPSLNRAAHTGYAYSDAAGGNWPPIPPATEGFNAYSGSNTLSPTVPNYETAINNFRPYNTVTPPLPPPPAVEQPTGFPVTQYPRKLTQDEHQHLGRIGRRIVAAPVADCSAWSSPGVKNLPVKGFACVLMLNPYDESGPQTAERRKAKLEYLGLASDESSPCGGGSEYAIAPVLAQ